MNALVMHSHVVDGVRAGPDCVCTKAPCGASVFDADVWDICPWHRKNPAEGYHRADTCTRPRREQGQMIGASTDEVVAWIAGTVARVLASVDRPGHDLRTVMRRMTTDRVMNRIRGVYLSRRADGATQRDVTMRIGQELIEEYVRHHSM